MRRLLLSAFRPIYRLNRWLGLRLTRNGKFVFGTMCAALLFGLDARQTLGYQLAALCAGFMIVALASALRFRAKFTVSRTLPQFVTCGIPTSYTVAITHHGEGVQRELTLVDCLHASFPDAADLKEFHSTRKQNPVDRAIGFLTFVEAVNLRRGGEIAPVQIPDLPPSTTTRITLTLNPGRRGELHFSHLEILRPDPLGLFMAAVRIPAPGTVLSLPAPAPAPRLTFRAHRRYQAGGMSLAGSVGDSQEFVQLRDYRPGDSLRHMHWRSLAKRNEPVVKEYQDEYFDRHAIVVDTFLSHRPPAILEAVLRLAAGYAREQSRTDSVLELLVVGGHPVHLAAGRGVDLSARILAALARAHVSDNVEMPSAQQVLLKSTSQLSTAICIFGDWDPARADLVAHLRESGTDCHVLVVDSDASRDDSGIEGELPLHIDSSELPEPGASA